MDELFECVRPFCGVGANEMFIDLGKKDFIHSAVTLGNPFQANSLLLYPLKIFRKHQVS